MYSSRSLVNQGSRTTQKTVANMMSLLLYTSALVAIVALQTPLATTALTYAPRVLNATVEGQICPSEEETQEARNEISSDVHTMISQLYPCGSSGWTRIAYFDTTDSSNTCPSPLLWSITRTVSSLDKPDLQHSCGYVHSLQSWPLSVCTFQT